MAETRISRLGQISVYVGKCFRMFVHEKSWKLFISAAIIGVIISWVIGDNTFQIFESTRSGVFALICACIWIGLFNSIQSICRERAIIKREHRTGLHISAYIIAHLIYEFVLCAVEALILTIILSLFRELPDSGVLLPFIGVEFFLGFLLVMFAADCLGLCVSSLVKTENAAMTVMPFVLIIQLVMSGMMFTLPENAEYVKYLTISKWGLDAICSSADINETPNRSTMKKYSSGEAVPGQPLSSLQEYDYDYEGTGSHVLFTWSILLCHCGVYSLTSIVSLEFIDRDKR